ncbi:MAG: hypothetical protein J6U91_03380 [Alistipes sp.]|nr:hypothetical protein [Alistipes sp.]
MKRYFIPKLLCLALVVALAPARLSAQQGSVDIVTAYTPEIAPATKLLAPTRIADDPTIKPEIAYQVNPSLWQISLDAHNFNPARASYWDYTSYKRLFAKIAAGYPLGSEARLHYTLQTPKVGYFGVGLEHHGDFAARVSAEGVERSIADSYDMQNAIRLGGGLFVGRYLFEGALSYDNDIYNAYAMRNPERKMFHDTRLAVKFGDEFVDMSRLNFAVEAHGEHWAHRLPMVAEELESAMMLNFGGSATLARDFSDNRLSLELEADWWGDYRNELSVGGGVGYARNFGFVSLDAGLGYLYDKVGEDRKASHYILPRAKLLFDLDKQALVPYVELNTTLERNNVATLFATNPYLAFNPQRRDVIDARNTLSYNLSAGLTGTFFSSRLSYNLYLGANFMRDQMFWFVTEPGAFGLAQKNNSRLFLGLSAEAMPVAGLSIDLDFRYHFDFYDSLYVQSESKMRGHLGVEYMLRKWKFYAEGELIGRRTWTIVDESNTLRAVDEFTMPTLLDLSVGVSYRASRIVEIYLNGENLLNSKIYDWANYYRQGIGFMAGVKIDF